MPRNPAAKKNQHNHKHENGLVGPGKRITKQKSNGQLNGAPRVAHPAPPPLPPINSDSLLNNQTDHETNGVLLEAKQDGTSEFRPADLRKRDSESSYDGQEPISNGHLRQKHSEDGTLRRQEPTSTKSKISHDVSSLQLASTILKSCPAYDTIAILILLLQLPPLVLTGIQLLFASLTFMPPAGISIGSMFSLFDVFQGSAGTPSLGTMIFVDVICFGLWFCVWTWAQNFALDLAQVQIAITLGGGGPGKSGGVNGICLGIVLLLHLVRSSNFRYYIFKSFLHPEIVSNRHVARVLQFFPRESEFGSTPPSPSWLNSLFAVHIVTQALMAFVRRRVAGSQAASTTKGSKRIDPEASAGSQPSLDQSAFETANSLAAGDYPPPPTPGFKDGKDKSVSAKKRRRQANQVRSRQPFWAALASTKVTVMREYEHSRGSTKSAGRQMDEAVEISTGDEVIWITRVESSTIAFEASNIFQAEEDQEAGLSMCSKPFFVRINGARWHSFSLTPSTESGDGGTGQWSGEISALAPNCTYTCSFVHCDYDDEFTSIMVKTPVLLDRDPSSTLAPPSLRHSFGPSSPATTIKNSIQNAEAKLKETRDRLAKSKRSHKAALSKIEKEVESYNSRVKSSSDDTKQRQKLLQAQNNIRQTEDATVAIAAALDGLAVIPEDEVADHSSREDAFQKQSNLLAAANEALASARADADGEISGVTAELNTIVARRERLTARQTRLTEQHDRITQANTQGLNEKERKAAESQAKEIEHARFEEQYHAEFNRLNSEIQNLNVRASQAWQEIQGFEKQASAQREMVLNNGGQLTPEGNLPGTNPPQHVNSRSFGYGFPSSSMLPPNTMSPEPVHASPFLAYAKALPSDNQRRARSASNRSAGAVSNFSADFEDADPIPPMPAVNDFDPNDLTGRKGSGSSRGHNNGSPVAMGILGGLGSPIQGRGSPGRGIW